MRLKQDKRYAAPSRDGVGFGRAGRIEKIQDRVGARRGETRCSRDWWDSDEVVAAAVGVTPTEVVVAILAVVARAVG